MIRSRRGVTLFQLLVVLAILVILFALLLPGIAQMRVEAARLQSINNLKQIGIAVHNYYSTHNILPPGNDDNDFSAISHLLPYLEQAALYQTIDFKKSIDDKVNAPARKVRLPVLVDPLDPVKSVSMDYGPTSYLFAAGTQPGLEKNNGIFYQGSKVRFQDITDGTSNTVMTGETLKGDSGVRAMTVQRQHILLKKDDLINLTAESGVEDFKKDKNVVANRCASWMDGRFLQGTYTATRVMNDPRPDVSCGGIGGLSALRTLHKVVPVAFADGSVRSIAPAINFDTWKAINTRNGGEVPGDF